MHRNAVEMRWPVPLKRAVRLTSQPANQRRGPGGGTWAGSTSGWVSLACGPLGCISCISRQILASSPPSVIPSTIVIFLLRRTGRTRRRRRNNILPTLPYATFTCLPFFSLHSNTLPSHSRLLYFRPPLALSSLPSFTPRHRRPRRNL